jgi:hypothetical protein
MKKKQINTKLLPVISFSGRKGYGKDFWAEYIVKTYTNVKKVAFADVLRDEVDKILELIENHKSIEEIAKDIKATPKEIEEFISIYNTSDIKYPELNSHSRTNVMLKLLQKWGTEVRRNNYGKNFWINKLYNDTISIGNKKGITYVISDARFPNEVDFVHRMKGLAVNIIISDEEQMRRLKARDGFIPDITQLSHISETGLDNYSNFDLTLHTEIYGEELTKTILQEAIDKY